VTPGGRGSFDVAGVLRMLRRVMRIPTILCVFLAAMPNLRAALITRPVSYEQGGTRLEGYLAYDDRTTTLRPGVLVVPEWWGLNDYARDRARQLAQLGYVAFAVDMYGTGVVTTDPKKAGELAGQFYGKPLMAERAQAALDQLLKTGLVDGRRVAAIGFCFGGAVCQVLAYSGAPLAGIVSFHGSLVPASPEAAARTRARFLICHGALDPFARPEEIAAFQRSLDDGKVDYQFVSYAGAVHSFTNPAADTIAAAGMKGVGYNATAARRSWRQMTVFFDEIFAGK
jgi:dienelactone hydrolase